MELITENTKKEETTPTETNTILEYIKKNKATTILEIAKHLQTSRYKAEKALNELVMTQKLQRKKPSKKVTLYTLPEKND